MSKLWKAEGVYKRADGKRFSRRLYTGPSRGRATKAAEATVSNGGALCADVLYDGRYRNGAWGDVRGRADA